MSSTRQKPQRTDARPSRAQPSPLAWCRALGEPGADASTEVGGKAASLAVLLRAGFPVPAGFVVTARAFEAVVAACGPEEAALRTAPPPELLRAEIATALACLPAGPMAVRSSAVAEDGGDASFAGQFLTVLNVCGLDAVLDAVRQCWVSAFWRNVAAYEHALGHTDSPVMAVLVQPQLEPRCAGVAFSLDPVSGERDKVVINAVAGLGERLVSGSAAPDAWSVRDGEAVCEREGERCLDASDALAIAELTRRVADHFGVPQDIEWAYTGSGLHLLQARPITALGEVPPVPVPVRPPHGFWERNITSFPHPLSPMVRSFFLDGLNAGFLKFFAECGALARGAECREIGGWVYIRLVPLGGRDLPLPPRWLLPLALRLTPLTRRRIAASVEAMRTDRFGGYLRRWHEQWRPALGQRAHAACALDLPALPDAALLEHVRAMEAFVREGLEIHFLMIGAHFFPLAEYAFTCEELLGWDERQSLALLAGLSSVSIAPAAALEKLAALARARPRLRTGILDGQPPHALLASDVKFARAYQEYVTEFGHRVLRYEISEPTIAEQPNVVFGFLRSQVSAGYDGDEVLARLEAQRAAMLAAARAQLAAAPAAERARFERALARAAEAYPIREDNEHCTVSAPLAAMRYAALELGRRLAAAGCIGRADHVFWLEVPEALAALPARRRLHRLVERRRGERAWVVAHPGPTSYGRRPPIPASLPGLPAEAEFVFRAGLWMRDQGFASRLSTRRQAAMPRIDGIGAACGRYTGPVRVVRSEAEFSKIQPGDVLVCPITAPVWSVLFAHIGALITDTGGMLSHSSIIAREYGIPAVVATGNATELLQDDMIVTVDGDAAEVELMEEGWTAS